MTRIDFYHYAADKQAFACRLATKAYEQSKRVVVYSPDAKALHDFDRALWSFAATKFVPHVFASDAVAAETPIVLTSNAGQIPHHDVLLNLGDEWPPFFASFERLLEIVAVDEEDKQKARGRYRFYRERGYDIKVNPIEAERGQGE
ncbi:MAG: DNA polymerase III subunit chi [Usitatibacter sp.]